MKETSAMLNFDEDFKGYLPSGGGDLMNIHQNRENLKALGIDPDSEDTVFGSKFVYCGAHMRAHATGWCTVRLVLKRPLNAESSKDANAEVLALGYPVD